MTLARVLGSMPGPATVAPQGLPAQLLARPAIAISVLVFALLLVTLVAVFIRATSGELADLTPGPRRRDLTAAAALAGGSARGPRPAGIIAAAGIARGTVPA